MPGPHTDKPGALCGWVRGCVAGELEVPSGWSAESEGKWWGVRTIWSKEQKATRGAIRGKEISWSVLGPQGPSGLFTRLFEKLAIITIMLTHCESDVNLFLPSYSGDPQPPTQSSPSPPWLHSRWTCLDLPGTGSHGQSGCPGVMAHVLGPERDGCGLASGNVHLGGQLRSPRNRGYSQRTSRVNGSLRLTLTGFRASHT